MDAGASRGQENSARFLAAFADIERVLRDRTKVGDRANLSSALKVIKRERHPLHTFYSDLMKFKDLRNAMIHDAHQGMVIAEPSDWAVAEIEEIWSVLNHPPRALEFGSTVTMCEPDTSISDIIATMRVKRFSQIPVRLTNGDLRLLTTDTVSRWIGASLARGRVNYNAPVEKVLRCSENRRNFNIVCEEDTVFHVLAKFDRKIAAVLVTPQGTIKECPTRIITAWDLQEVQDAADWHLHLNPGIKRRSSL